MVEISQRAREAALPIMTHLYVDRGSSPSSFQEDILDGEHDDHYIVEAFSQFEQSVLASTQPRFIEANSLMIPMERVDRIDLSDIRNSQVVIILLSGEKIVAQDFDAYRIAIMSENLEGKAMRWVKHSWAFHNIFGHPILQIFVWLGMTKLGLRFHDWTAPKPIGFRKK